jgi:hypothetical protein
MAPEPKIRLVTEAGLKIFKAEQDSAFGHNPDLRKWYAALGKRYFSAARVLVIGDSNSEGSGVAGVNRRWQAILQAELRGRYQPPGVLGSAIPYITASPRVSPGFTDHPTATVGSPTLASYGLGLRALSLVAGQSVTFTFTGDRAKLLGTKGSSAGRYNISLDGAAGTVVDGFASGAPTSGNLLWDSGLLAVGVHTVAVTRDAGTTASPGAIFPEGLLTFNGDHDRGVRVLDAARHGATLATFSASTAWSTALTTVGTFGLLIMAWGANDSTAGTTAATFRANLMTIISQVRAAGFSGSVLLVKMPKRGNATEQLWGEYRTEVDAIAAGDPDITTLDLRARMPDHGTSEATALGLYADEVHYLDAGQGWIADQIATAVFPR